MLRALSYAACASTTLESLVPAVEYGEPEPLADLRHRGADHRPLDGSGDVPHGLQIRDGPDAAANHRRASADALDHDNARQRLGDVHQDIAGEVVPQMGSVGVTTGRLSCAR